MSVIKRIVKNRIFVGLAMIAVVALATVEIRQLRIQLQVQSEIAELTRQAELLQKENTELQKLSDYLKTEDYVEKAAREQLNKKREGEYVYSFSETQPSTESEIILNQNSNPVSPTSNPYKWWGYFFGRQS
jgi:cell division protein FtsB